MGRTSIAEERRSQILEAFRRCAMREGLQGASMKKIAAEAGVQPGILHHYFKDRNEMIEELVISTARWHTENFRGFIARARTPKTRFDRAVDFLFGPDLISDDAGSLFYDFWSEGKRNERVRMSFAAVYADFRRTIIDLLAETGRSAGAGERDIHDLACMIVAMYEGVFLQWDFDRDNIDLKRMKRMLGRMIESVLDQP